MLLFYASATQWNDSLATRTSASGIQQTARDRHFTILVESVVRTWASRIGAEYSSTHAVAPAITPSTRMTPELSSRSIPVWDNAEYHLYERAPNSFLITTGSRLSND